MLVLGGSDTRVCLRSLRRVLGAAGYSEGEEAQFTVVDAERQRGFGLAGWRRRRALATESIARTA